MRILTRQFMNTVRDGTVFTTCGEVHVYEITPEPGIQGCLAARQKSYKII